jgi:arabinose-5-phosphate isomerase
MVPRIVGIPKPVEVAVGGVPGGVGAPGTEGEVAAEAALARRVFAAEAEAVAALARSIGPEFHRAVDLIVASADSDRTVLVTGLGKSGLIGSKIAATLASVAIPSHFVHPSEAAHGDLGRFRPGDACIALSHSGETDEVVNVAAVLRQDGIPIIAVTKGGVSALSRLATVTLAVGDCDDAAITPAPTCSTTAALALGDALAVCAAARRRFTVDEFAKRHPGGALGGLLRPVGEVLRFVVGKNLTPIEDDVTLRVALERAEVPGVRRPGMMLLVSRGTGKLSGVFTDADLRRLVQRSTGVLDRPVSEVMTRSPSTLESTALVRDAVRIVREFRRDEIPIVDGEGRPMGVLDVQDLVTLKVISSD